MRARGSRGQDMAGETHAAEDVTMQTAVLYASAVVCTTSVRKPPRSLVWSTGTCLGGKSVPERRRVRPQSIRPRRCSSARTETAGVRHSPTSVILRSRCLPLRSLDPPFMAQICCAGRLLLPASADRSGEHTKLGRAVAARLGRVARETQLRPEASMERAERNTTGHVSQQTNLA